MAEDLATYYFRQAGKKDQSIQRAVEFLNNAIEDALSRNDPLRDPGQTITGFLERVGGSGVGTADANRLEIVPGGGSSRRSRQSLTHESISVRGRDFCWSNG
ncbi:MAG: hypothetical protein V3S59_02070 [Alphaproteobacteria bacterium]